MLAKNVPLFQFVHQSSICHSFEEFQDATREVDWAEVVRVVGALSWFGDRYQQRFFSDVWKISSCPDRVERFQQFLFDVKWKMLQHAVVDVVRTRRCSGELV